MWVLREHYWTYDAIGQAFHRDHSTVHHALAREERRRAIETDPRFSRAVQAVREALGPTPEPLNLGDLHKSVQNVRELAEAAANVTRAVNAEVGRLIHIADRVEAHAKAFGSLDRTLIVRQDEPAAG